MLRHCKQVCSHWRNVAINSPALWTYIYISKPPTLDGQHVLLYLARSGPTTPLVIDIEMRTYYLSDLADDSLEEQVNSARETFDFLVAHGGTTERWDSFIFCAKLPSVLFEAVRFLNTKSAPSLRFLSLWWKTRMDSDAEDQEHECLSRSDLSVQDRTVSGSKMPLLRNLDLNALPIFYEAKHSSQLATSLTRLKLVASLNPYPLPKLHALLSSNLQLESLTLSAGLATSFDSELTTPRIHLPFLRSLSLDFKSCSRWAWGIIDMVDAPGVEHLHLSLAPDSETIVELVNHMTIGVSKNRFTSVEQAILNGQPIPYKPIYPSLRHLIIESNSAFPDTFRTVLSIFPTVTHASLPDAELRLLRTAPWVFPNLECISTGIPSMLCSVLHLREEAGLPVKKVEISRGSLWAYDWPGSVEVVERRVPSPIADSDIDDDWDDDWDYHDYDHSDDYWSD